ncbi:MAG: hypothetical protein FWG65_01490 [Turicibacter sp.]|nr:hypothetical protein [Turicibacter sp.]
MSKMLKSRRFGFTDFWNDFFSHIYVEEEIAGTKMVRHVLDSFPKCRVVPIKHYKDVFNRAGQEFLIQKYSPKLILASRKENFLYEGASVCERYGHSEFYYTTLMMNCLYNCAYCYLQTIYQSANLVAFVNQSDYFAEITKVTKSMKSAYISLSYETDLLALEHIFGYVKMWAEFADKKDNLIFEIRTKSANFSAIETIKPPSNMILTWTMSPQPIIDEFEEATPPLIDRIKNAATAISKGWQVRLAFDPTLTLPNWENNVRAMIEQISEHINIKQLHDVSIGEFRMSDAQYKKLKKMRPQASLFKNGSEKNVKPFIKDLLGIS